MFGKHKKNDFKYPPPPLPPPRRHRKGGMETILVFVKKCAGHSLRDWEADVLESLVKAANENEAMHG